MIKKRIHIVFLLFFCFWLSAQNKSDSLAVNFHLEFNKLPLQLNKKYVSASNDTLTIETFRCYISNIQIQYEDNSVFVQKESYHLLDSDNPNSFSTNSIMIPGKKAMEIADLSVKLFSVK